MLSIIEWVAVISIMVNVALLIKVLKHTRDQGDVIRYQRQVTEVLRVVKDLNMLGAGTLELKRMNPDDMLVWSKEHR